MMNKNPEQNVPIPSQTPLLVIGEGRRLFLDPQRIATLPIHMCHNVLEGIHQASSTSYDVVAVQVAGLGSKLTSALQALRKGTCSRLILLASMVEEPLARRLVESTNSHPPLVDDYLICPLAVEDLYNILIMGGGKDSTSTTEVEEKNTQALTDHIRQLERLATEDDLTGLKNRRYVWEFARQILQYAAQAETRITLFIYDIDDFKHYNDQYGHAMGDRILKEAAVLMQRSCRGHDVVGRIGGDEFAVIFWDDPQVSQAPVDDERRTARSVHPSEPMFIARRFQAALKRSEVRVLGPEGRGTLTISGGLSSFPEDGTTLEQLFEKADQALLEAKRSGKNRIYLVGGPVEDLDTE